MDKPIHMILTGGTIDSHYDGTRDTAVPNDTSVLPQYVKTLRLYQEVVFTEICMTDSRELNDDDLERVLKTIVESKYGHFIITHGTYTMPDTARYLKAKLGEADMKQNDKTIIITGSMIPLTGFSPSDAPFNLGYAIGRVQELNPGVYVAMNGRIFQPEEVLKRLNLGRFASIFGER